MNLTISPMPTPNPNAWKYVLNQTVLNEGKATYSSVSEAVGNRLAEELLMLEGIKQIHFFQNVITVTHTFDADISELNPVIESIIKTRMVVHNPNFGVKDSKKMLRESLPPDVQKIEEILDDHIRPGLQGDGGDIDVIKFEENKLYVQYQGACGTCPSSTSATLSAIEGILRDNFNPEIEVIPV